MKQSLVAGFTLLAVIGGAQAMEVEVRGQAMLMSGPVTGIELRVLESTLESHPDITTVVLKNSNGGDARSGYAVGEFIRAHKLNTALSGFCISSCSRMFLGGVQRQYSDEQPLNKTFVGLHGNYAADGSLQVGRMGYLKDWVIKYSDGKANPDLVEQWVHIPNHHGYIAFYHRDASILPGTQKVMLCQGTEDKGKRQEQCAKPEMGDALANGIVTSWEIYPLRVNTQQAD
ncbi:hypothetical protein DBR44_00010 [Aquitalea sp. FJL05]|uniref:hypothetical protein n=1 Tax=Aquitalea sp. FJL05 TaxID=2153366 RepID=UPI000F5AF510|nr:hypothetical protein [Aquitalea sp. FJL05]RQO78178.1 hypothetical protein DBR44_00010 [Aquitalea sp. FJL05]